MKKQIQLSVLLLFLITQSVNGQQLLKELKPSEYFDFWIGQWELTWKASGGTVEHGTNTIERVLDGKVIKENFEATSGQMKGYIGKSYSVYNPKTQKWKQTWVDNQGAYLDFTGKFEGPKRMFVRQTQDSSGNTVMQRMVFYDIKPNSFTWDWERSTDNGKNWQLVWKIAYRRH